MENDRYCRTVTADGYVDAFIPGEVVAFAKQNKAVRERLAAREADALREENRKLGEKQRIAKQAAKAARKRQRRAKLGCQLVLGVGLMLGMILAGLIDQVVGTLFIAAGAAVLGYQIK